MRVITTLENLLSISATRFKVADEDFRARSLNSRAVRAATARAYSDIATAIAIHKRAKTDPEYAREAIGMFLRDAEAAELVAHYAKDRARRLGAY
jgi:hypothetical protein